MNKPISITLGEMAKRAEAHLSSGRYASMSELMRAGLRALDREEAALDAIMQAKVAEALADTQPRIPIDDAFARIKAASR